MTTKTMDMIYEGKAKRIFATTDPGTLVLEFKDSLTAFNAQKKGSFEGKGRINRDIAAILFHQLKNAGIPSHFVNTVGENEMTVRKVKIIPLEVVVRNILAGSTAKKMGIEEGKKLPRPLVEFYFKDDALADPFVSDDQIIIFDIATAEEIRDLKTKALQVNEVLAPLFSRIGLQLVDFKLEFGKLEVGQGVGTIVLADEITPDCCRLWDTKTGEKMDKDRFRRDLGKVDETYQSVLDRLKTLIAQES